MLLAIDIGNSSVKFGLFENEKLVSRQTIPTADIRNGEVPQGFAPEAVIISSVVPEINGLFSDAFGVTPIFVDHTFDLGLTIKYDPPNAVGIDRLVTASAAAAKYGAPCIVCGFGTAATIDAVNSNFEYLGGTITPGITTFSKALFQNTAKLPEIEISRPDRVIGNTTERAIRSGIFFGYLGLVEGIVSKMKIEMESDVQVIATGGFVKLIVDNTRIIDVVDENLMLEGLCHIYSKMSG